MSELSLNAAGVRKVFPSGEITLEVLRGIDLEVRSGESVAILGASGAGKSTLLHILGALDVPSGGTVELGGEDMFALDDARRSEVRNHRLGFVFQFHYLLAEFSAVENAGMPLRIMGADPAEANRRAAEILTELGLGDRLHHRPAQLSGGEQQRVAVARALVHQPDFVLADEPTGNLDSENSRMVARMLFGGIESRKAGFVLVTHNESLAAEAEKSYLLRDGKLYRN
ncbi:MAG: ABC transporter ATP-binding protein [Candidatus Glassbacteria bacterium]|nr:ABC transporter ATP-binding protein [Candidatus Glassbacteria bacterium]